MSRAALAVFLLCCVLMTSPALAHRVNVFAWVQGGVVFVEGGFSRGNPAQGATVEAYVPGQETPVFRGVTDAAGELNFPLPTETAGKGLRVVLLAGEGHRNEWTLTAEDLGAASPAVQAAAVAAPTETTDSALPAPGSPAEPIAPAATGAPVATVLPAQLEQLVAEAVRRELAPMQRQLAELQRELAQPGPTVQDITAGIGFLFGLAGVAMLVKRKQ